MVSKRVISTIIITGLISALVSALFVFSYCYSTSPKGSDFFVDLSFFLLFSLFWLFIAACSSVIVSAFMLNSSSNSKRIDATNLLAASLTFIAVVAISYFLANELRISCFRKLADRSDALIQAITSYEQLHGTPPSDLHFLVPDFLPDIPDTGMGAYPSYEYLVGEVAEKPYDNPWVLYVDCPAGRFLDWDRFYYFPRQNYSASLNSQSYDLVGEWAYLYD
ncbi:hypothetical protein ACFLU6_06125 [Acidobacteriota bacterium]